MDDSGTDSKTDGKTEIQTEANNVASSSLTEHDKKVIYAAIKNTIRLVKKSQGLNKKVNGLK